MKTSKLENPKLMVPHGAMESTVSCPHFTDEHSSVERSGGTPELMRLARERARVRC